MLIYSVVIPILSNVREICIEGEVKMIRMEDIHKTYSNEVTSLNGIYVHIDYVEFLYIGGCSSVGKSTIIRLMYGEEKATNGNITILDQDVSNVKNKEVPYLRRDIGVVFQDFKLLPRLTIYENVAFALEVIEASPRRIRNRVMEVLDFVGL